MAREDGGKNAALLAAGVVGGFGLAKLLEGKPVEAAPDTEKLSYIASLLEQMGLTQEAILLAIKDISLGGGIITFPDSFLTPWKGDKDPLQIYQQAIRSVGVFQSDVMVDMRNVKRLTIKAESSLDQAVALQLVGNFVDSFNLGVNVGPPAVCPINGQAGIGLAWGDWMCYVGVQVSVAIAPTAGILTIVAVVQE